MIFWVTVSIILTCGQWGYLLLKPASLKLIDSCSLFMLEFSLDAYKKSEYIRTFCWNQRAVFSDKHLKMPNKYWSEKKYVLNFSEKFTLLREEYSFLKKHYWNKFRYFMEAILYLRILLSHSKNGLLTSFEVISLIEFCFKLSYLSTISSELQIHALGKSTLFSVLTLLYIQDSFPWKSHCLKITKNLISPEPSTSALKL